MNDALAPVAVRAEAIRVLLVEDSVDHQMLSLAAMRRADIDVSVAGTAEEALELLDDGEWVPHLVLIDQGLPRMSGTELLARIVQMDGGPGAIMVTGSADSAVAVTAMRLGAIDFVSKDAGYFDVLPSVVQRAFSQYDLRRRTRELQRLALLVHASTDIDTVVDDVVAGACKLLGAHAAVLLQADPENAGQWRPAARIGDSTSLPDMQTLGLLSAAGDVIEQGGLLVVRLPTEPDERTGVLVVARSTPDSWLTEDRELAKTFAAYVSSALRHARRAELEGGLIEELQQSIRARRDFVASVSHELRTPLTSIGGYAETILEHAGRLDQERQLDLVSRIRRNAQQLERMIDELIDVARMERGAKFSALIGDVELASRIEASLSDLGTVLSGAEVQVHVDEVTVRADPELVHRVMANLLTNAVKYSPEAASVVVTSHASDGFVRVEVRDHGIGVNESDAALVFQPFWRAGYAVAQAVRGAGIGLALVREYVTGMGGQVGLEQPVDGRGAIFWFTLPVA